MCARSAPCSFEIVAKGFSSIISGVIHGVGVFWAESLYLQERVCLKKS